MYRSLTTNFNFQAEKFDLHLCGLLCVCIVCSVFVCLTLVLDASLSYVRCENVSRSRGLYYVILFGLWAISLLVKFHAGCNSGLRNIRPFN